MRAAHSTFLILLALAANSACDSDRLVTPDAKRSSGARLDALASETCRNVHGSGNTALDPATGQLGGSLSGDLTGTHTGVGTAAVNHGHGAISQTALATYATNEFGTFVLAEELVIAHISPTVFKVTLRAHVIPGADVKSGFLMGEGYMDLSGLPQGEFEYHGRLCT